MSKNLNQKVALITGVSSGLGRELAQKLLAEGVRVAGTVRNQNQIAEFEALSSEGNALGIHMDITNEALVQAGVAQVFEHYGRIDILANNAGAGTVGAVEETSIDEAQRIFDINFFGGMRVTQAVLPYFRQQGSGHVLQFSAIGGFLGYPGLGVYSAAKGATDILGEAMAGELKAFGIDVTVLTIGIFKTEFAGRSLAYVDKQIEAYEATPVGKFRGFIGQLQGKQPNDATKGAAAIIEILKAENPPVHAALGADAQGGMRKKLGDIAAELTAWEANASSTAR